MEQWIHRQVKLQRDRLEEQAGLRAKPVKHYALPLERPFAPDQRAHTIILFDALTDAHGRLIEGMLRGLGYRCEALPVPDLPAFHLGREYGNNALCCPAYFNVGNLIRYLYALEARGLSGQEIIDGYVYLTPGACGPCRFGIYETEYRAVLRNAGFDGFRVLVFEPSGGLDQTHVGAGPSLSPAFSLGLITAFNMADLLNELARQIRPYEVVEGQTDRVMAGVLDDLHRLLSEQPAHSRETLLGRLISGRRRADQANTAGALVDQLTSQHLVRALRRAQDSLAAVQVDRFRVKPVVKVTGEFWAQRTEGDGNYQMLGFLEKEGAEVLSEPVAVWLTYTMRRHLQTLCDQHGMETRAPSPRRRGIRSRWLCDVDFWKRYIKIVLAERVFEREYNRLKGALGGTCHDLVDQSELQRMAEPFYNPRCGGGEGYLEIASNIYYHQRHLAHMVLSLKPFGCLPSTQSDGVQAALAGRYEDMLFLAIEVSGEGDVHAYSRVDMVLGSAWAKARQEFDDALASTRRSLPELRAYVDHHPELKWPTYKAPHRQGIVGTAAAWVLHVASLMDRSAHSRAGAVPHE